MSLLAEASQELMFTEVPQSSGGLWRNDGDDLKCTAMPQRARSAPSCLAIQSWGSSLGWDAATAPDSACSGVGSQDPRAAPALAWVVWAAQLLDAPCPAQCNGRAAAPLHVRSAELSRARKTLGAAPTVLLDPNTFAFNSSA